MKTGATGNVWAPHDFMVTVQKSVGNAATWRQGPAACVELSWARRWNTARLAHDTCVNALLAGLKLADPGVSKDPQFLIASTSILVDIFTTAAVPRRGEAPGACAAPSNAAAARGDAAHAAFERQTTK